MRTLDDFLNPTSVSLKICGVKSLEDAERLASMGVDALGFNFWPPSKRHLPPTGADWLRALEGTILRVGVFVNQPPELPLQLIRDGWIDVVQLHGDETPQDVEIYRRLKIPFIKGIGVKTKDSLQHADDFGANAVLLDAHAPGVYGGTGETFDWNAALEFQSEHPALPVILAGGIVAENAATAARHVHPAALDVASGAEHSPGVKDFDKVAALLAAIR